jgi:hypothetical protein
MCVSLLAGEPFFAHRAILDTYSPFLREVLADADAAAEHAAYSSSARQGLTVCS